MSLRSIGEEETRGGGTGLGDEEVVWLVGWEGATEHTLDRGRQASTVTSKVSNGANLGR